MSSRGFGRRRGILAVLVVPLLGLLLVAETPHARSRHHNPFTQRAVAYLEVSVEVVPRCRLETVPVAFPGYTGLAAQARGAVRVTCSSRCDTFVIALSAGDHYLGGEERRMSDSAGGYLRYVLRTASGRLWGDRGYGDTYLHGDVVHGSAAGGSVAAEFPVEGTLAAEQRVPAGAYADAVWVTLDF